MFSTFCSVSTISSSSAGSDFIGAIILIRNFDNGLSYTLMMFLSIWLCDTFAFVFGSAYGVKKLIPLVSPNKTWFGTICGFLSSFIVPMIFYIYYPIAHLNFSDYIIKLLYNRICIDL